MCLPYLSLIHFRPHISVSHSWSVSHLLPVSHMCVSLIDCLIYVSLIHCQSQIFVSPLQSSSISLSLSLYLFSSVSLAISFSLFLSLSPSFSFALSLSTMCGWRELEKSLYHFPRQPFSIFLRRFQSAKSSRFCFLHFSNDLIRKKYCSRYQASYAVWPDCAKFCHFCKNLKEFGNSFWVYLAFGKISNLLWHENLCYKENFLLLLLAKYW